MRLHLAYNLASPIQPGTFKISTLLHNRSAGSTRVNRVKAGETAVSVDERDISGLGTLIALLGRHSLAGECHRNYFQLLLSMLLASILKSAGARGGTVLACRIRLLFPKHPCQ